MMSSQIQGTAPTQVNRDPAIKTILQYQVNPASQVMQMPPLINQVRRIQCIQVQYSLTNIQSFGVVYLCQDSFVLRFIASARPPQTSLSPKKDAPAKPTNRAAPTITSHLPRPCPRAVRISRPPPRPRRCFFPLSASLLAARRHPLRLRFLPPPR